jgi:hypothetical protein
MPWLLIVLLYTLFHYFLFSPTANGTPEDDDGLHQWKNNPLAAIPGKHNSTHGTHALVILSRAAEICLRSWDRRRGGRHAQLPENWREQMPTLTSSTSGSRTPYGKQSLRSFGSRKFLWILLCWRTPYKKPKNKTEHNRRIGYIHP